VEHGILGAVAFVLFALISSDHLTDEDEQEICRLMKRVIKNTALHGLILIAAITLVPSYGWCRHH